MLIPDRSVPRVARYTWSRQWKAEVCAGFVEGLLGLAAFAAMRSLGAGRWIAPLFVTVGQLFWIAAPMWEAAFARFHFRRAFLWMGVVAAAPMLLVAFIDVDPPIASWALGLFAAVIVIQSALDAAYLPHRGALLRANVPEAVRGRLFGMLSTISKLSSIAAAKAGGLLLDSDARWLRVIFPVAGVFGLIEHWILSRIHWRRGGRPAIRSWSGPRSAWTAFVDAWREAWRILVADRAFLAYEAGFMLYGMGFLMSSPMMVVYAERELRLSYDEWTWANGAAMPAAYVVTILLCGRVVDRVGVLTTGAWSFRILACFFVAVMFVADGAQLVACYAVLGAAMAMVNLAWNLGPLSLAPPGKARTYAAIHVLFVGLRSAVAPFLGLWIAERFGVLDVFACSAALVCLGAVVLDGPARRRRPASAAVR
jgi:hypothetical protein